MSQVRYQPLGPLLAGEGSRAFLGLALEEGVAPRPVVLVWAPPEVAQDAELSAGLQRETQRASVLEHPNILRVHGLVSLEAGLARVTEFADGESLRRMLEVRPRIPPAFAALIASDVAMGVHYAHLAGNDDGTPLVHGDLRPETVMVSFDGVCKVTGYGALSVAPRERNGRRVAQPAQLQRPRAAHRRSRGHGRPPPTCSSWACCSTSASRGACPSRTRRTPIRPSSTARCRPCPRTSLARSPRWCERATAKRANERYSTALEFREAVVAAVQGLPSAETFSEFLSTLFPPDRDARATRRQMLEIGLADVSRRVSGTGFPAVQPAPFPASPSGSTASVAPVRPSGEAPPVASAEPVDLDDIPLDVALQEEDANAIDTVLELTGRHARPGVARPLAPPEEARPPRHEEPEEIEPEEVEDESPPKKQRSRVPLIVGALATAAAAAGFFVWNERQQASTEPADPDMAAGAQASPTPPRATQTPPAVPANAGGLALAPKGDAGVTAGRPPRSSAR